MKRLTASVAHSCDQRNSLLVIWLLESFVVTPTVPVGGLALEQVSFGLFFWLQISQRCNYTMWPPGAPSSFPVMTVELQASLLKETGKSFFPARVCFYFMVEYI